MVWGLLNFILQSHPLPGFEIYQFSKFTLALTNIATNSNQKNEIDFFKKCPSHSDDQWIKEF